MARSAFGWRRTAAVAVLILIILWLAYLLLQHWLLLVDERAMRKHNAARGQLLFETAATSCASVEEMERAAAKLGWATQRIAPPYDHSLYNKELPLALRVWIKPPVPFGKLDFDIFQFDQSGCLVSRGP